LPSVVVNRPTVFGEHWVPLMEANRHLCKIGKRKVGGRKRPPDLKSLLPASEGAETRLFTNFKIVQKG